jgi:hypothetical protein
MPQSSTKIGIALSVVKIWGFYMKQLKMQEMLMSLLTYEQGVKERYEKIVLLRVNNILSRQKFSWNLPVAFVKNLLQMPNEATQDAGNVDELIDLWTRCKGALGKKLFCFERITFCLAKSLAEIFS